LFINGIIDDYGWQMSWQILAVCLFIFSFCVIQFYRNKPEDFGLVPDGVSKQGVTKKNHPIEKHFTLQEAKKTRAFWMIGLALAFNSFFTTGFTFHVVSIFENQAYTKAEAISVFIPISIIAITVSTLGNVLSDYLHHKLYLYIMLCSGVLATLGLFFLGSGFGVYLLISGLGIYSGLFAVVNAVTWPRYFGRQHLGAITGKVMSFLVIASAIAPSLFSYCYTILGSYANISYLTGTFLVFLILGALKVKKP
jgi:MFS family permease